MVYQHDSMQCGIACLQILTQSIVDVGIKERDIGFVWLILLGQIVSPLPCSRLLCSPWYWCFTIGWCSLSFSLVVLFMAHG